MDLSEYERTAALQPTNTGPAITLGTSQASSSDLLSDTEMNDEFDDADNSDQQSPTSAESRFRTNPTDSTFFHDQLVITTQGTNLVLHDFSLENETEIARRPLKDDIYQSRHEHFCMLDVYITLNSYLILDRSFNVNDFRRVTISNSMASSNGVLRRHRYLRLNNRIQISGKSSRWYEGCNLAKA